MVGLGNSALELTAIPKETFHITEKPKEKEDHHGFWDFLIGIVGGIASALTGGVIAPLLIGLVETTAITLNDYNATGSIDWFNTVSSLVGLGAAEAATVKGIKLAETTTAVATRVDEALVQEGASSLERDVFKTTIKGVVTKQLGAEDVAKSLVRAGMTEDRALSEIKRLSNILKEEGVKAFEFQNQAEFILQESNIFEKVVQPLRELGIDPDIMFDALRNGGINVTGIKETSDLVKAFRSSSVAFEDIQRAGLDKELESILERDIEPTVFTRILNANKAERLATQTNKLISFVNPNTVINEVANKIFDPLKNKLEEKVVGPLKKRVTQKLKHILKQDIIRKKGTKNGVYPCFASQPINYLRAVPLGAGKYKCFVVWRKWGYQPVLITPPLTLEYIIRWSESSSPGHIYHQFRREYGKPRGTKVSFDSKNEAFQIFNLLGFIPDKYIALGVSLIGNITTATAVISQDLWGDFAHNEAEYLHDPIRDKILEIGGGEFGKAVAAESRGQSGSVQAYFEGKVQEATDSKQNAFRASGREGKGKVDAITSMSSVIK